MTQITLDFDGSTFDREKDSKRLSEQFYIVKQIMLDHSWHTLAQLEDLTGFPQASISARIRDLRKSKFGAYIVSRKRVSKGTFAYRLEK